MTGRKYALLVSVSRCREADLPPLPACRADLAMMRGALVRGLRFEEGDIRSLGEDGEVSLESFARALGEFSGMLGEEDVFLLYFSGHGSGSAVRFSDRSLDIRSLTDYIGGMRSRSRILILDCCFAGNARADGTAEMREDETAGHFSGRGTAILASSAPDELSWLNPDGGSSRFTSAVCTAMLSKKGRWKGRKSLYAMMEEIRSSMRAGENEGCLQHPQFRADMGGTVFFQVEDETRPAQPRTVLSGDGYELYDVKPLDSGEMRRIAAFVCVPDGPDPERVCRITSLVSRRLRRIGSLTGRSGVTFDGRGAGAVWCYCGRDAADMEDSTYFAYGLWAKDRETRRRLFRRTSHACVRRHLTEEIYIWQNPSYEAVRRMREEAAPDYGRADLQKLLGLIVSRAEQFITDLRGWQNGELLLSDLRDRYGSWRRSVFDLFIRITDTPVPPPELREWSDAVIDLAGWVLDLALVTEPDSGYDASASSWLLNHAVTRYYESLERIRAAEEGMRAQEEHAGPPEEDNMKAGPPEGGNMNAGPAVGSNMNAGPPEEDNMNAGPP